MTWKDTSSTIDLASPAAVRSLEEWFSGRWKRVFLLRFSEATRRKVSRGQSSQSEPCCRCVVEPYIPSSEWNLLVHRRFVLHTLEADGKEFCFYGSRWQRARRFHEDIVVKVNLVVGAWWSHTSHRRSGIFWFIGGFCSTPLKLGIRLSCPVEVSRSAFYPLGSVSG